MSEAVRTILGRAPVVPVITIDAIEQAVPLARALVGGGIPVLEITLRTAHGLEAIRRIRAEVEGAVVGAGTVLTGADLDNAIAAGSEFIVTPGLTDTLLQQGANCGVPFLPGIATVSELMRCLEHGQRTLKFFPAEAAGGAKTLKAFAGPFPGVAFCPTGGIGLANIADYLAVPSVLSVGGSWLTPASLVTAQDWPAITALAREACKRVRALRPAASQ